MNESRVWSEHGYIFSVAFGVIFVTSGWFFVWLFGVPVDAPLKDVLKPIEVAFFFWFF